MIREPDKRAKPLAPPRVRLAKPKPGSSWPNAKPSSLGKPPKKPNVPSPKPSLRQKRQMPKLARSKRKCKSCAKKATKPKPARRSPVTPPHKRFVAKPPAVARKLGAAKPRPRPIFRVKPAGILASDPVQPAAVGSEANIQVPRELTPPPADDESESNVPIPPSADESR